MGTQIPLTCIYVPPRENNVVQLQAFSLTTRLFLGPSILALTRPMPKRDDEDHEPKHHHGGS